LQRETEAKKLFEVVGGEKLKGQNVWARIGFRFLSSIHLFGVTAFEFSVGI
jgi:hypothetical protein